jgi:hypothetical protein
MPTNGMRWPSHWYGSGIWNLPDPHFPCGKRKYVTKGEAKLAIKRFRASTQNWIRKGVKPSAYKCNNCGMWHWGHKRGERDGRDEADRAGSGGMVGAQQP